MHVATLYSTKKWLEFQSDYVLGSVWRVATKYQQGVLTTSHLYISDA